MVAFCYASEITENPFPDFPHREVTMIKGKKMVIINLRLGSRKLFSEVMQRKGR